jgi:ABC-type uncharacterized transport system ATPase subunit
MEAIGRAEVNRMKASGADTVIQVEHLRKAHGPVVAADDVSFEVRWGVIFGIVGPNGAGKTTTVECMTGMRTPDGGSVEVLAVLAFGLMQFHPAYNTLIFFLFWRTSPSCPQGCRYQAQQFCP